MTIEEAREKLRAREVSSEELTRSALQTIREREPEVRAFLEVNEEAALQAARESGRRIASGEIRSPLEGIPGAIKDNILVKGFRATAASKILENYVAPYDATVIARLRDAGAVIVGKTNLDEFAMGSSTENSAFGPTRNPWDLERVPGGSSGGSAAAVAAREALWALGSDTGGSIRQPAGFCGVVGLKPTYGAVSRYGLIAMASSLDQIGPFANTVRDAALVFEAIAGYDGMDATSNPMHSYLGIADFGSWQLDPKRLRIGVPKEYFSEGLEPQVERAVRHAIQLLERLGAAVMEISLPHTSYALPCYYIIQPAEVSANLARYDGIRYGLSQMRNSKLPKRSLEDVYFETRGKGFGPEVKRRILLGTYVLSAGYYEAYYAKAQKVRRLVRDDFLDAFKKVDVIVAPTSPTTAFTLGERTRDPLSMYLADVYTVSVNLAGLPALSLPCGRAGKLPIGLQLIGRHFEEKTLLRVGDVLEQEHISSYYAD